MVRFGCLNHTCKIWASKATFCACELVYVMHSWAPPHSITWYVYVCVSVNFYSRVWAICVASSYADVFEHLLLEVRHF